MDERREFTVESARAASARGRLGEWVTEFLASPGSDNAALGEQLAETTHWWCGPVALPLDRLHRLAGPQDAPVLCPVDDDFWGDDVDRMEEKVEDGWDPPPVVVTHRDGQLVLEDGTHRVESLRRAGLPTTWAVVGFAGEAERDAFVAGLAATDRTGRPPFADGPSPDRRGTA